jgi:hypothetical protein
MTISDLKFSAREVVGIVLWASSIVGLYFGIGAKIADETSARREQAVIILQLQTTIAELKQQAKDREITDRALERAVSELTVTLRVSGVIK